MANSWGRDRGTPGPARHPSRSHSSPANGRPSGRPRSPHAWPLVHFSGRAQGRKIGMIWWGGVGLRMIAPAYNSLRGTMNVKESPGSVSLTVAPDAAPGGSSGFSRNSEEIFDRPAGSPESVF